MSRSKPYIRSCGRQLRQLQGTAEPLISHNAARAFKKIARVIASKNMARACTRSMPTVVVDGNGPAAPTMQHHSRSPAIIVGCCERPMFAYTHAHLILAVKFCVRNKGNRPRQVVADERQYKCWGRMLCCQLAGWAVQQAAIQVLAHKQHVRVQRINRLHALTSVRRRQKWHNGGPGLHTCAASSTRSLGNSLKHRIKVHAPCRRNAS